MASAFGMLRVVLHRILSADIASQRFWRVAAFAAAGAVCATSRADAAFYYWQDSEPGAYQFYRPEPVIRPRRSQPRHPAAKKDAPQKDTGAKPQAPLIIA